MEDFNEDNLTGKNHEGKHPNMPLRYLTAKSIIGDKVHDENDAPMGEIGDIMIDITTGTIDYVVIEFGGFLTMGTKYFAIPFDLLEVNPERKNFIVRGNKEKLIHAPGFDVEHWPDTNFHREETYWHFMD